MTVPVEQQLDRIRKEGEFYGFLKQMLENSETPEEQLIVKNIDMLLAHFDEITECTEQGKPFIAAMFTTAPEIYTALDIPWYMIMHTPFMAASAPFMMDDIDAARDRGFGSDLCTAIRLSINCVEAGITPIPHAIISLLYPCDGAPMLHQIISHNEDWQNVPVFAPDPPYHADERSVEYFAQELKRMVAFLEEHLNLKMDIDHLREVISESNKQYELWGEYNELRRTVPCPHGWNFGGPNCFAMAQCFKAGDPNGTEWFRQLVDIGEQRVREGRGQIEKEKIRFLWFDILPQGWSFNFMPWLEQKWGAVMVMDMFGNFPYQLIDTTNEDTMFKGLAARGLLHTPMIRQALGRADNFLGDIVRIVKDYKIDCVIWPGHMGHKDSAASVGMMREVCRDIGVPFLHIGLDLYDSRYTSVEQVKERCSQFFSAHGFG